MTNMPEVLREKEPIILRAEVMQLFGYKSLDGFKKMVKRTPDFPSPLTRTKGFNARIYYLREEIAKWWEGRFCSEVTA